MAKEPAKKNPDENLKGPEHGQVVEPPKSQAEPPKKEAPKKEPVTQESIMEQMRQEISSLRREIREKKVEQKAKSPEPKKQEEIDWDKAFLEDANRAMADFKKSIIEEVRAEVVSEYSTDQNQREFWNQFYHDNPDLKEDRDLVEMTMQSNLADLAEMPASEAAVKIAELTRERILRYSSKKPKGQSRTFAEGGGGQKAPTEPKEEENNVTTLSDVIKQRRQKRFGAGKSSAA